MFVYVILITLIAPHSPAKKFVLHSTHARDDESCYLAGRSAVDRIMARAAKHRIGAKISVECSRAESVKA